MKLFLWIAWAIYAGATLFLLWLGLSEGQRERFTLSPSSTPHQRCRTAWGIQDGIGGVARPALSRSLNSTVGIVC